MADSIETLSIADTIDHEDAYLKKFINFKLGPCLGGNDLIMEAMKLMETNRPNNSLALHKRRLQEEQVQAKLKEVLEENQIVRGRLHLESLFSACKIPDQLCELLVDENIPMMSYRAAVGRYNPKQSLLFGLPDDALIRSGLTIKGRKAAAKNVEITASEFTRNLCSGTSTPLNFQQVYITECELRNRMVAMKPAINDVVKNCADFHERLAVRIALFRTVCLNGRTFNEVSEIRAAALATLKQVYDVAQRFGLCSEDNGVTSWPNDASYIMEAKLRALVEVPADLAAEPLLPASTPSQELREVTISVLGKSDLRVGTKITGMYEPKL